MQQLLGHPPENVLAFLVILFSRYLGIHPSKHFVGVLAHAAVQEYVRNAKKIVVSRALVSLLFYAHLAVTDKDKLDAFFSVSWTLYLSGCKYLKKGDYLNAINAFNKSLLFYPTLPHAQKKLQEAKIAMSQQIEHGHEYLRQARSALVKGDLKEARSLAAVAIGFAPCLQNARMLDALITAFEVIHTLIDEQKWDQALTVIAANIPMYSGVERQELIWLEKKVTGLKYCHDKAGWYLELAHRYQARYRIDRAYWYALLSGLYKDTAEAHRIVTMLSSYIPEQYRLECRQSIDHYREYEFT